MKGNFLRVRTDTAGSAYSASFSFTRAILINDFGIYNLTFYSIINCNKAGCDKVGDKISIKIKNGADGIFEEVYNTGSDQGRSQELQWLRDIVAVQITSSEVFVSS